MKIPLFKSVFRRNLWQDNTTFNPILTASPSFGCINKHLLTFMQDETHNLFGSKNYLYNPFLHKCVSFSLIYLYHMYAAIFMHNRWMFLHTTTTILKLSNRAKGECQHTSYTSDDLLIHNIIVMIMKETRITFLCVIHTCCKNMWTNILSLSRTPTHIIHFNDNAAT
jgi:hypothetical protein